MIGSSISVAPQRLRHIKAVPVTNRGSMASTSSKSMPKATPPATPSMAKKGFPYNQPKGAFKVITGRDPTEEEFQTAPPLLIETAAAAQERQKQGDLLQALEGSVKRLPDHVPAARGHMARVRKNPWHQATHRILNTLNTAQVKPHMITQLGFHHRNITGTRTGVILGNIKIKNLAAAAPIHYSNPRAGSWRPRPDLWQQSVARSTRRLKK